MTLLLDRAIKLIARRPRSKKEITLYLKKKKACPTLINQIVKELQSLGLIDDREFALWWIGQRQTFRPKGKYALQKELQAKGIDRTLVESLLESLNEEKEAQKALKKRLDRYQDLPALERKKKITAFLQYRGFSWETIKKALEKVEARE